LKQVFFSSVSLLADAACALDNKAAGFLRRGGSLPVFSQVRAALGKRVPKSRRHAWDRPKAPLACAAAAADDRARVYVSRTS